MNIDEVKQQIAERTGLPVNLLTGETAEENIIRAKALLAYAKTAEPKQQKTGKEAFAEWLQDLDETDTENDSRMQALKQYEDELRGYPSLQDKGEAKAEEDTRPAGEQFATWFASKTAYNPRKNAL